MGIVVFIRSVHGRFEGHLRILDILGTEDILYLGSLRMVHPKGTNFNARTHVLWNNALLFTLLGFLYLSGGSIW